MRDEVQAKLNRLRGIRERLPTLAAQLRSEVSDAFATLSQGRDAGLSSEARAVVDKIQALTTTAQGLCEEIAVSLKTLDQEWRTRILSAPEPMQRRLADRGEAEMQRLLAEFREIGVTTGRLVGEALLGADPLSGSAPSRN